MANKNIKDTIHIYNGEKLPYTALAMKQSRLKKAKEACQVNNDCTQFNELGGDIELKKLDTIVKKEQDTDYRHKKVGMDAGRENQFIKTHEKDENKNAMAVGGIPQVTKGSVNDKILSNKEVYNEGLKNEISDIRYLIEYMNNNNKKQKL